MTPVRASRRATGILVLGLCSMPAAATTPAATIPPAATTPPAATMPPPAAAMPEDPATPENARRAYDAGRFTDAMGIWAELDRQGNPDAAYGLGMLYDLGNGTPEDPETAFYWYRLAAEAGLPAAEFNVAAMYESGRGVARSNEQAATWFAKAAAHGHHRAQFDLGLLYEHGDGVPHNGDAAAAWLREAANGGLSAATDRLKALEATASVRPKSPLMGVALASPERNVVLVPGRGGLTVELVWVAPGEPEPVHYEVQVRELGGPVLRTVFTASVTTTATVVRLPANADFYVWNVDTVGRNGSHAPGEWNWFSVASTGRSEQSMTSVPGGSHPNR